MNFVIKQLTKEKILFLLKKADYSFVPYPLSKKTDLNLYSEKLAEFAVHFFAEDENELIGMCCCYLNDPKKEKAFISVTCVDPNYFGKGLGQKLTTKCEIYAKDKGYKYIEFEVHIDNTPSIEMHKKIGYYIDRQVGESFFMKKFI
jgi:ribosomal protein S18 acetylase RimI-like enzyme